MTVGQRGSSEKVDRFKLRAIWVAKAERFVNRLSGRPRLTDPNDTDGDRGNRAAVHDGAQ